MEQVRFNPFNQVHKGLRAMLYHTAFCIQHTDFTDNEATNETIAKVKQVIELFEEHAHTEDTMVFPLLKDFAPQLVTEFEQQHVRDHELGNELEQAVNGVEAANQAAQRIHAGFRLQQAFAEFTAFNLSHMNQEETIVKGALWERFTDEELWAMTHKIVATIPQEKNIRFSYWMLKGLSMTEIILWYKGMKADAPSFVFEQMMGLAESALSEEKYNALQIAVEAVAIA